MVQYLPPRKTAKNRLQTIGLAKNNPFPCLNTKKREVLGQKAAVLLIAFAFIFTILPANITIADEPDPLSYWADIDLANSDTSLTGAVADGLTDYYEYNTVSHILTIKQDAPNGWMAAYRIRQSGAHNIKGIIVNTGVMTTVIIDGVTLTGNIALGGTANLTLLLAGSNIINGSIFVPITGENSAALQIDSAAETGSDSGMLTVTATDSNSSGIGSGNMQSSGCITINGGTVTATGGFMGAGIGGSNNSSDGYNIIINGGTVTATGGSLGAGIGGGKHSRNGNITINNGNVTAIGGSNGANAGGAGIGGGYNNIGGNITINNGTVTATGGYTGSGIGIGTDSGIGKTIIINGGTINATGGSNGGVGIGGGGSSVIIINEGTIIARGGGGSSSCAGIGGGHMQSGGSITITGGVVTAYGGDLGAGIGSGYGGDGGNIIITGDAEVTAYGKSGAGIGGGGGGNGGTVIISGNAVVTASSNSNGAGIGGGTNADGNTVIINGNATVTAWSSNRGAGIGGGSRNLTNTGGGCGGNITITGNTTVTAIGGNNWGAGIGGSRNPAGAAGQGAALTIDSTAVVTAYSNGTFPAIHVLGSNAGNGYYVNNRIGIVTYDRRIDVYAADSSAILKTLTLPANYSCYAYTTGNTAGENLFETAYKSPALLGQVIRVSDNSPLICSVNTDEVLPVKIDSKYRIIYKANGGTGLDYHQVMAVSVGQVAAVIASLSDTGFTAPANAPGFAGWNTKADGTGTSYGAGDSITTSATTVLYAQWISEYDITYVLSDGMNAAENPDKYDTAFDTFPIPISNPVKAGYVFVGWTAAYDSSCPDPPELQNPYAIPEDVYGNLTLTAHWVALGQEVKLKYIDKADKTIQTEYTVTPDPVTDSVYTPDSGLTDIAGYIFVDWKLAGETDWRKNTNVSITVPVEGAIILLLYGNDHDDDNIEDICVTKIYMSGTAEIQASDREDIALTAGAKFNKEAPAVAGYTYANYGIDGGALQTGSPDIALDTSSADFAVTYYYTADTDIEYTVHYYFNGTTMPIQPDKVMTGQTMGTNVTESAEVIDGYTPDAPQKILTLAALGNVIVFDYSKNVSPGTGSNSGSAAVTGPAEKPLVFGSVTVAGSGETGPDETKPGKQRPDVVILLFPATIGIFLFSWTRKKEEKEEDK